MPKSGKVSASKSKGASKKAPAMTGQLRSGLIFAPARCQRYLRSGRYADRMGASAGVFMAGVLQYLSEEILELSGKMCLQHKRTNITPQHINLALRSDEELSKMLYMSQISDGGQMVHVDDRLLQGKAAKDAKAAAASQVV